ATPEEAPKYPVTPYGISKFCAELIHEGWFRAGPGRRLIVVRPGVIYGPGDPGNMLRMIRAVKRGYFFFPGSPAIRKSYGYIFGLLESIEFMLTRPEPFLAYNYVESETDPIGRLVELARQATGSRAPTFSVPIWLLGPAADFVQWVSRGRSPIHPARVRKAGTPTWIIPARLQALGFPFRYGFARSLDHWRELAPEDFA
ncbi:MAG: NAD-dependent epimerase/dehydratase family protein, partial [Verrucomicrobiota bacterium]|nr:NAD-dependent epimerase/dehydratase family protein [Verrucomicrobiota bacterium]